LDWLARQQQEAAASASIPVLPRTAPLPVSFAQQRLLSLAAVTGDRAVYHIPGRARLDGPLDVGLFQQAFAMVVQRHDALRTTFSADGEHQIVHDTAPPLSFEDLSTDGDPADAADQRIAALMHAPLDLTAGPLL